MHHVPLAPRQDNGWASWFCTYDGEPCSSDGPCLCCVITAVQDLDLADRERTTRLPPPPEGVPT
jgi:hypothetical protein